MKLTLETTLLILCFAMQAVAITLLFDRDMPPSSTAGDCTAEETVGATHSPEQKQTAAKEQPARPDRNVIYAGQSRIYFDAAALKAQE